MNLQGKHKCIENVSRQNCPICLEDIHTSRIVAHVLPCGHLLHRTCYEEMLKEGYRCPLCMHSALDMTRYWRQLDDEVAQTPMPSEYQNMTVDILCNDCNGRSTVQFHILGMKCNICESYNTAQAGGCRISLDQQWAACASLENSAFSDTEKGYLFVNASIYAVELMCFVLVSQHKIILQDLRIQGLFIEEKATMLVFWLEIALVLVVWKSMMFATEICIHKCIILLWTFALSDTMHTEFISSSW